MKKQILTSLAAAVSAAVLFALPAFAHEGSPCGTDSPCVQEQCCPDGPNGCEEAREPGRLCSPDECDEVCAPDSSDEPEKCGRHEGHGPKGPHKHGRPGHPGRHMAPPPPPSPEMQMQRLSKELNLSSEQQAKIRTIMKNSGERRRRVFEESRQEMEKHFREMQKKMQAECDAVDKEVEAVLNADQKVKFSQLRAEREKKMKQRFPGRHHGRRPAAEGKCSE